ncbi:MAG TPA: ABC transporter ATP-binding protein [Acidobacteriota bacterium]|nr:ABC transporter ATP-binding protein [Acidobacteriota bacterium]
MNVLQIENVSKRFSAGNYGVKDFTLSARNGVLGLLGPNGAGKTTLMQMIATITRPTKGTILFQGTDIIKNPEFLRSRLGYLPQDFGVYENLTAIEFLSYFASLKGVHSSVKIQEMLEMVNLHTVSKRQVGGFSGGMKQRLGIAQALINDPELLIVDEPTAGLDPEERVRFRNILTDIGHSKLVILSTHIVSDIESIATEIAIMKNGGLVTFDAPENLMKSAEGRVWEAIVSSDEFEEMRRTFKISGAVRKPDGVHLRIVSRVIPHPTALPAEPALEEAFLLAMDSTSTSPEPV